MYVMFEVHLSLVWMGEIPEFSTLIMRRRHLISDGPVLRNQCLLYLYLLLIMRRSCQ